MLALGFVALFTLLGQFFIQNYLNGQKSDSRIINVAGRQRMLSQKLAKEAILVSRNSTSNAQLDSLRRTLYEWRSSQNSLQNTENTEALATLNTSRINALFDSIRPIFRKIETSAQRIISLHSQADTILTVDTELDIILANEPEFLELMNAIVSEYEKEARQKVDQLKVLEYILLGITLLILILEFFFLLRPAAVDIRKVIERLVESETQAQHMAKRADLITRENDKALQELKVLTNALDQTVLFARVYEDGTILSLGNQMERYFRSQQLLSEMITEILQLDALQSSRFLSCLEVQKGATFHEEFLAKNKENIEIWLSVSFYPLYKRGDRNEFIVLCMDISKQKAAQSQLDIILEERFTEQAELQRSRASQIVEAQEEERKRIAKEIHDSIGQMLTALKFNIESISLKHPEKAALKIEGLKQLSKDLISGVRMATFNLTPPELMDYGVAIALQKMTVQLSKMTGKHILLQNKSDFNQRFDSLVETNLYRVTQEAVNNAIKYANTDTILVTINHSPSLLSIVVDDNGQGMDLSILKAKPKGGAEGGMGVFFMKERMSYIDGRLFINSSLGQGTRVTLNYPLPTEK